MSAVEARNAEIYVIQFQPNPGSYFAFLGRSV
jgi:hypothetical protein